MFHEPICLTTSAADLPDQVRRLHEILAHAEAGELLQLQIDGEPFMLNASLSEDEIWRRLRRQSIKDSREGLERLAKR